MAVFIAAAIFAASFMAWVTEILRIKMRIQASNAAVRLLRLY
jgi:hypothetical protein